MALVSIGTRNDENIIINSKNIFDICVNVKDENGHDDNSKYHTRVRLQKRNGSLEQWTISGKCVDTIMKRIEEAEKKERAQAIKTMEDLLQGRLEERGF